jgi:hypothetical protein
MPLLEEADWSLCPRDYDADDLGLYLEVFTRIKVAGRHAVKLSVEQISASASHVRCTDVLQPDGMPGELKMLFEEDFRSLPASVTYEFHLRGLESRTSTFLGLGGGVYFTTIATTATKLEEPAQDPFADLSGRGTWDTEGYGFHCYVGQRITIGEAVRVVGTLRARWVEHEWRSPVELSGVDLSIGVEWLF